MILTKTRSLGLLPFAVAIGVLGYALFVVFVQIAQVRSTVPVVSVRDADGIGVLEPLEYTPEYGVGVTKAFLEQYYNWTPETFQANISAALAYVSPDLYPSAVSTWGSRMPEVIASKESQIATVEDVKVFDFNPDVGLSVLAKVRVEKYYSGIPYKPLYESVTLVLENSLPRPGYPFCLSIVYVNTKQITLEGQL